jgi:hypothetical protein
MLWFHRWPRLLTDADAAISDLGWGGSGIVSRINLLQPKLQPETGRAAARQD